MIRFDVSSPSKCIHHSSVSSIGAHEGRIGKSLHKPLSKVKLSHFPMGRTLLVANADSTIKRLSYLKSLILTIESIFLW